MPISPASLSADGKQVQAFTADAPGVWSTDCGTLWTDAGCTAAYAGASTSGPVYFKAQNITSTGIVACTGHTNAAITIYGVFPAYQSFPYEWQPDKRGVVVNTKRDGSINGRVLGDGVLRRDYKLVQMNNVLTDYAEVEQFWNDHYPNKKFKYVDRLRNFTKYMQFNSKIKVTAQSHQRINYEVETIEVP